MDNIKFETVLTLLVPQVIQIITEKHKVDEITVANDFYHSKVYAVHECEETKVWHFSALTLFNMYDEEKMTGDFVFPEET